MGCLHSLQKTSPAKASRVLADRSSNYNPKLPRCWMLCIDSDYLAQHALPQPGVTVRHVGTLPKRDLLHQPLVQPAQIAERHRGEQMMFEMVMDVAGSDEELLEPADGGGQYLPGAMRLSGSTACLS